MIKINLKNTKTSVAQLNFSDKNPDESTSGDFQGTVSKLAASFSQVDWSEIDSSVFIRIAFNLILIVSFPMGLKVYEIQAINQLKLELKETKQISDNKAQEVAQLDKQLLDLGGYEKEVKEFDDKKNLFKQLANDRRQVPKLLDQIQSVTPKYVWLKNIELNIKERIINISGESVSEDKVAQFVSDLGLSVIDSNSAQFNTSDLTGESGRNKLQFNLKAKILTRENI